MKYAVIESMCHARGGVRGCPHDGLGCTGGDRCSINSRDIATSTRAYNATAFGADFICAKRERRLAARDQEPTP